MEPNTNTTSPVVGSVLFIPTNPGVERTILTERLSNVLRAVDMETYILRIDVYVEECLRRRAIPTDGSSRTFELKKPKPCYKLSLMSQSVPIVNEQRKSLRLLHLSEAEIQLQVLHAYIEKLRRQEHNTQWALLVESSYLTRFDYIGLQLLSERFNFFIHWLPSSSGTTKKVRFANYQLILSKVAMNIYEDRNTRRTLFKRHRPELQTLHQNIERFEETEKNHSSRLALDSFDVTMTAAPHFRVKIGVGSGNSSIDSFTTCDELSDTDSSDTESDIDLKKPAIEAMLRFSKELPPPDLERYIAIGQDYPDNNIWEVNPVFVVLVRDIFPGPSSHISSILKEKLRRNGIKTRRLIASNLFRHSKSAALIMHFTKCQHSPNVQLNLRRACTSVFLNIIHYEISQEQNSKGPIVMILDIEDETYVRIFTLQNFCLKVGLKVFVLEKRPDGTFERNFNRVYAELKTACSCQQWKPRQLKIPTYNEKFIKKVLPFQFESFSNKNGGDTSGLTTKVKSSCTRSRKVSMPTSTVNPSSTIAPVTEVTNPITASVVTPILGLTNSNGFSTTTQHILSTSVGNQIFKVRFPKSKLVTRSGDDKTSSHVSGGRKTKFNLIEKFGVSNLNSIFKTQNQPNSIEIMEEKKIENHYTLMQMAELYDARHHDVDIDDEDLHINDKDVDVTDEDVDMDDEDVDMWTTEDSAEVDNVNATAEDCNANAGVKEAVTVSTQRIHWDDAAKGNIVEGSQTDLIKRTSTVMCSKNEDFLPSTILSVQDYERQSLIEICRRTPKKRRKMQDSEESLFKGWVGVAHSEVDQKHKQSKGFFSRIFSSIRNGIRKLF